MRYEKRSNGGTHIGTSGGASFRRKNTKAEEIKSREKTLIAAYETTRPKRHGAYSRLAEQAWRLCKLRSFNEFTYTCVLASCCYAGATTYASIKDSEWMHAIEVMLAVVFLAESALKIVAEGVRPWMYFKGSPFAQWNCFDFCSKFSSKMVPTRAHSDNASPSRGAWCS
jgi:hypothetical protein